MPTRTAYVGDANGGLEPASQRRTCETPPPRPRSPDALCTYDASAAKPRTHRPDELSRRAPRFTQSSPCSDLGGWRVAPIFCLLVAAWVRVPNGNGRPVSRDR